MAQRWTFKTLAERDAFIGKEYSARKCTNVPGVYRVPGGTLSVFMSEVTFYPVKRKARHAARS